MNEPEHQVRNSVGPVGGSATVIQAHTVSVVRPRVDQESTRGFGPIAPPPMIDRHGPLRKARARMNTRDGSAVLLFVHSEPGGGGSAFGRKALYNAYARDGRRFPGGVHFADLGREDTLGAVTEMLRRMGVSDRDIPASRAARAAALRAHPAWTKPVAVLLDSPRTFSEILPFVATSPRSVTVVVTSAEFDPRTLTPEEAMLLEGLSHSLIHLGDLGPRHARALFHQISGSVPRTRRERAMVADFVSAAGHRPGRLAAYANAVWQESFVDGDGLARAHADLLGPGSRDGEVSPAVMILRALPQELRGLAGDVARLPDTDVGPEVVAALGRGHGREIVDALETLVERRVLGRVTEPTGWTGPRYAFRSTALHRALALRAEEPMDDLTAVLDHYAAIAYAGHRALAPQRWTQFGLDGDSAFDDAVRAARSFTEGDEARMVLSAERRALNSVLARAVEAGRLQEAAELCELLWPHWFTEGMFADVADTHEMVLRAARGGPHVNPARLSRLSVQNSIAHRRDLDLPRARAYADRAVELAEGAAPQVRASAHEADGDVSEAEGRIDRAVRCYTAALDTVRGVDDRAAHIVERKIASVLLGQEDADLAAIAARLAHARSLLTDGDHQNHARTHTEFARLRVREGDTGAALEEFDRAIARHGLLHDRRRMADNHVLRAGHAPEGPRVDLERALERYREVGADQNARSVQRRLETLP